MSSKSASHKPRPQRKQSRKGGFSAILYIVVLLSSFASTVFFSHSDSYGKGVSSGQLAELAVVQPVEVAAEVPEIPGLPDVKMPPLIGKAQAQGLSSSSNEYAVQAVLSPERQVVVASGIDARITEFNFENGDKFKDGDVLVEYDCSVDRARLDEALSRQRVTQKQLEAYEKLVDLESVSDIELVLARENNEQNKAMIGQIKGRLKSCTHTAPFDGHVVNKMASQYEYVQAGRVLMDVASSDPLRAEFLIPSTWLRWLNIGTPLSIYIGETGREYSADIIAVHGEVDPVSRSVQVVAQMEDYHEELLPGMSGRAMFDPQVVQEGVDAGFLGLTLNPWKGNGDGSKTE